MEIKDQIKLAQHIFRLLKVSEIVFPIGRTNKGNLGIKFSQNSEDYEIMLDAVPLSVKSIIDDDNNIELKKMIEKYWFDSNSPTIGEHYGSIIPREATKAIVHDTLLKEISEERTISDSQFRGTSIETRGPFIEDSERIHVSDSDLDNALENLELTTNIEIPNLPIKRRGRPAGSKNKK